MDSFKADTNFSVKGELLDEARLAWQGRWLDKFVWAQTEVLTKAKDYSNFIIVAGYAAFFGLWAGLAGDVDRDVRLVSGGLIGVSLLLFVFWELVSMHLRMQAGRRLGQTLGGVDYPEDFAERWDAAVAKNSKADLGLLKIWPWIFYPTALTGLVGGGTLAVAAFAMVLAGPTDQSEAELVVQPQAPAVQARTPSAPATPTSR